MRPTKAVSTTKDIGKTFKLHGAFLKEKAAQGTIGFAGYTSGKNPGSLSIVVLNAKDIEVARAIMAAAPAVSEGLLTTEIEEFEVFLSHSSSSLSMSWPRRE